MNHQLVASTPVPARLLAGDIGGTHTRLAIYSLREARVDLARQQTYSSADHASLGDVLKTFLDGERASIHAACLGLPAPIRSGVVSPMPNLPWKVDRRDLFEVLGTESVILINDVEASAAGIPGLSPADQLCIQRGEADPEGNRVVVSVGTGLGVSALTASGRTFATEAGHASFAPSCDPDFELQAALRREYGHVSWERVASGPSLPRIHALFAGEGCPRLEGPEIVRRAATDPACAQTLETFRRYLGSAAGDFALTLNASGGLYLRGGVAPHIFGEKSAGAFLDAFRDKGRMRHLLERIPVFVVTEDSLSLCGAAQKAIDLLEATRREQ